MEEMTALSNNAVAEQPKKKRGRPAKTGGNPPQSRYDKMQLRVTGIVLLPEGKLINGAKGDGIVFTGERLKELGLDVADLIKGDFVEPVIPGGE